MRASRCASIVGVVAAFAASACNAGRPVRPVARATRDVPPTAVTSGEGAGAGAGVSEQRRRIAPPVPCRGAYPPGFAFVVGAVGRARATPAEPAPRVPFIEPDFGTCLVRVTDRAGDRAGDDHSAGLKNEYARVNSFNADESAFLIRGTSASWYVYDARTFAPVKRLPFNGAVDPRWHPRDPGVLYYTPDTRLVAHDVRSGRSRTVRDFAADFPEWRPTVVSGRWEGSPSLDGTTFAFIVRDRERGRGLFVYDLRDEPRDTDGKPGEIVGRYDLSRHRPVDGGAPDSVSMSLTGGWVWAQFGWCRDHAPPGTFDSPCGAMAFDRSLTWGHGVVRRIGHADLALDARGRDVAVFQDNERDEVAMVDLATGEITSIHPIDFRQGAIGFHFSGRAALRPGWALVSAYSDVPRSHQWLSQLVYAVELRAAGRIVPLAHHHSRRGPDNYFAEPHASTNLDFTRVLFTSNWGRGGDDAVDTFVIALPSDWPARLRRGERGE